MYANSGISSIKNASSVELGLNSIARATTVYIRSCIHNTRSEGCLYFVWIILNHVTKIVT